MNDPAERMTPRPARIAGEVVLTAGALVGALCVVAAIAAVVFGVKPLIVRSGSMEPALPLGSLALATPIPAQEISVGDIVSVTNTDAQRVTHRVIAMEPSTGGSSALWTKGDANRTGDAKPFVVGSVDRVFWTIPLAGYVAAWLSTPAAWLLCALVAALLAYIAFRPTRREHEDSAASGRRRDRRVGHVVVVVTSTTVVALAGTQVSSTRAAFTDAATFTSGAFTTAASLAAGPRGLTCLNNGYLLPLLTSVRLSWDNAGPRYSYRLTFTYAGALGPITTTTSPVFGTSHNVSSIEAPAPLLSSRTVTVRLYTLLDGVAQSTEFQTYTLTSSLLSVGGVLTVTCGSTPAARARPPESAVTSPSPSTSSPGASTSNAASPTSGSAESSSEDASPTGSTTTAPQPPASSPPSPPPIVLPAGGIESPSGDHAFYVDATDLAIRDLDGVVYQGTIAQDASTLWQSDADVVWVVDGPEATRIAPVDGTWTATRVPADELPAEIAALVSAAAEPASGPPTATSPAEQSPAVGPPPGESAPSALPASTAPPS